MAHPDWENNQLQIGRLKKEIEATLLKAEEFIESQVFAQLRVYRTESLAHALEGPSRDRSKFNLGDADISLSFDQVLDATAKTVDIVDRIISHWEFHIENSFNSAKLHSKYTRMFWNALPVFSEVEDLRVLDND